ncbi:MAG: hypothetical protein NVS2B7_31560 [Herpetosiphon sp.]
MWAVVDLQALRRARVGQHIAIDLITTEATTFARHMGQCRELKGPRVAIEQDPE